MGDTEVFLGDLEAREHDPLLEQMSGTLLVELLDDGRVDRVLLRVRDGRAVVDRSPADRDAGAPDCVVRASREMFDGFVTGRLNAMTAFLRGEIELDGDPNLLMRLGRLFPGPQDATAAPREGAPPPTRSRA
jgi:hypothetical protein